MLSHPSFHAAFLHASVDERLRRAEVRRAAAEARQAAAARRHAAVRQPPTVRQQPSLGGLRLRHR
ncbi:MAG TPA: hypothetical protein VI318_04930 [Baekduia sp.]